MFMTVVYPFQGYMVHSLCDSGVGGLAPMAELAPPSPKGILQTLISLRHQITPIRVRKPINIPIKTTRGSVKLGSTIVHELRLSILVIHHQHVNM